MGKQGATMSRSDYRDVVPSLTEARIARQYAAVVERAPARPRRGGAWVGWTLAAGLAVVLAFTVTRKARPPEADAIEGAVVESSAADSDHPWSLVLADGSRVALAAASRARLTTARAKAVRIDLEHGAIEIEATHVEGRTFVVGAGPYEVRVVGTHFEVRRDLAGQVTVRVDRGVVEVAAVGGTGESRRLGAGEQWSGPGPAGTPAHSPAEPSGPAGPAASNDAKTSASGGAGSMAAVAAAPRHDEGARELFDDAQRARAEGRSADAARAFDRLRRTYPRDARAALAAFELGRLRLDALGDPRGAEEALRDAIALGPSSPFREDAESRRIEALGRIGDAAGCASARAAYLARWPNGTYRRAVELGCGDR
jgi:transmembrane sensor